MRPIYKGLQLLVLSLGVLLLISLILLQLPQVKAKLASEVVEYLTDKTGHEIALEGVEVAWLDHFSLENLHVKDLRADTMVSADRITIDFSLDQLWSDGYINLDDIYVKNATLHLIRHDSSSALNLKAFLERLSTSEDTTKQKPQIKVSNVELDRVVLKHSNRGRKRNDQFIDPNHLALQINQAIMSEVDLWSDTLNFEILGFSCEELDHGMTIQQFKSAVHLDPQHIVMAELLLEMGQSTITDSLAFTFDHIGELAQFFSLVRLDGSLKNTRIATSDLRYFAPVSFDSTLLLSGKFSGPVSNLTLRNIQVSSLTGSKIEASGSLIGLPTLRSTFMDLDLQDGWFQAEDIRTLLGKYSFGDDVQFEGNFSGFLSDFVAYGFFRTPHGTLRSNLNFKVPTKFSEASYKGQFQLADFDLGRVVQDTIVGTVDMIASIEGQGLRKETANFFLEAQGRNLKLNRYEYDSLWLEGQFTRNYYDGSIRISDPHCTLQGLTKVDLRNEAEILELNLDIDTLHLQALNWTGQRLDLTGNLLADLTDLKLDSVVGLARFRDLVLTGPELSLDLGLVEFSSEKKGAERLYKVKSAPINATLTGVFDPSAALKDIPQALNAYQAQLLAKKQIDTLALNQSGTDQRPYKLALTMDIKEIDHLMQFVGWPVNFSNGTHIEAEFRKSKNINMSILLDADSISSGNSHFNNVHAEANVSHDANSPDVLALVQVESGSQRWEGVTHSEKLFLESVWFNNDIDSRLVVSQNHINNHLDLNTRVTYHQDSVVINLKPSDIVLIGNPWSVERRNAVVWSENVLDFRFFQLNYGLQQISIDGAYSNSKADSAFMKIDNFPLAELNAFLEKYKFDGTLDLELQLSQDSLRNATLTGSVFTHDIHANDVLIGDVNGDISWDRSTEKMTLDLDLIREGVNTIDIKGKYDPRAAYDQLDVNASLDGAGLELMQPLVGEVFDNISGSMQAQVRITGPLTSPVFSGSGRIDNGQLTFPYTNTTYKVSGDVQFDSYEISFQGLQTKDLSNGTGTLYGSVYHENLKDLKVNFFWDFDRMQLLNTSSLDNTLYYGRAYGTGNLNLNGPLNRLSLRAQITSDPGTRVFFPLEEDQQIASSEFITFVNPSLVDSIAQATVPKTIKTDGMSINLDLNVTEDAYAELIFDAQTGDIIRGRTKGNLQFQMDPTGEFSLLGGLEIASGAYNFTVPGVNKEFKLRSGGTLSWSGDPYQGTVNLQATYRQIADLKDWDSQLTNTTKIPFLVVLDLEGDMLQPDISFRIETADDVTVLPGADSEGLRRFLISTNDREDELNLQVFSLLMLRKLSPQSSFQIGRVDRGLGSSVSEIVSNQLSYWLSQSNENLEVDIDLANLDENAFNTFQYRLAYSFLDGRLRVSGGNNVNGGNTAVQNTDGQLTGNNALIGNWSVEYLLTSDGQLRAKIFSRSNQSLNAATTNAQQTGISLQLIKSFDQFRELVSKKRTSTTEVTDTLKTHDRKNEEGISKAN